MMPYNLQYSVILLQNHSFSLVSNEMKEMVSHVSRNPCPTTSQITNHLLLRFHKIATFETP